MEVSGLYGDDGDNNYALTPEELADLKQQVAEAQTVLGDSNLTMVPELGAVKMTIDVYSMLNEHVAQSLGFTAEEPAFISFSFEKSHVPLISCTQRVNPGYGVKNHLKGMLDHFFHCWHHDRDKLKKVGRPPAGLGTQIDWASRGE